DGLRGGLEIAQPHDLEDTAQVCLAVGNEERLVDFDVAADVGRVLADGGKGGRARLQPFSLDGEVHDEAPDVELVVLGTPQAGQVGARIGAREDLDVAVAPTEPQLADVVLVAQALHDATVSLYRRLDRHPY